VRVAWGGLLESEFDALAQLAVVPSATELLAEHGVSSGAAHAPRDTSATIVDGALPWWSRYTRTSTHAVEEPRGALGGDAALELVRIAALLLAAAYITLAAKAPRFHTLGPRGAAAGPKGKTD
jgi:hypothetical protein